MMPLRCPVVLAAVVGVLSPAGAGTIHVDAGNCPGPGGGTVEDPYCSIRSW